MNLHWRWCRFDSLGVHELYDVLALRCRVFILEQGPYQDPDGLDRAAWHLQGRDGQGGLQAYLRALDPGAKYAEPSIGRVITAPEVRGTGLGRTLMREGLARCAAQWPRQAVRISAQARLRDFYAGLGFVADSPEYLEDGIPHLQMIRKTAMHDLILHHYASSPFSEKVRLVLGYKKLDWRSVTVPVIMPKPDVVALTGGYRRTPFLQIGADVYCDTALMCRVIDRLAPQPPLLPAAAAGLAPILAQWADSALFWAAVPLTIQTGGPVGIFPDLTPEFLKAFAADRAAMSTGVRRPAAHDTRAHLASYLGWLEQLLADERAFVLGAEPCLADFAVAQSLWFIRLSPKAASQLLPPYPQLAAWLQRVEGFRGETGLEMSSTQALAVSAAARDHAPCSVDPAFGLEAGAEFTVNALDYGADPVAGRLVGLSVEEVVLEREDERAGRVHVHFPRIGYQIRSDKR